MASWSTIDEAGEITLRAGVFAVDGSAQLTAEGTGSDGMALGVALAEKLLEDGAADLIDR